MHRFSEFEYRPNEVGHAHRIYLDVTGNLPVLRDTFDDVIPYPAWITWIYAGGIPGAVGQYANLAVYNYFGEFVGSVKHVRRARAPIRQRRLDAGDFTKGEYADEGVPDTTVGDAETSAAMITEAAGYNPLTHEWYHPVQHVYTRGE
jgi:hypothetical protein